MGLFSNVDEFLNNAKNGNFDELINKTKDYGAVAVKKSAETIELSKKKIELLDSKTKLAKAYEAYGKLQYSIVEGSDVDDDAINSSVEEIALLKGRVDALTAEVEDMKASFISSIKKPSNSGDIEVTVVESESEDKE